MLAMKKAAHVLFVGTSESNMNLIPKELWFCVLTYLVVPWKIGSGAYFYFSCFGASPGLKWIPGQCLLKAFKGKCRAAAAVAI